MAALLDILLDPRLIRLFAVLFLFYLFILVIYRLYFDPLAKFPGPKIAAITRYYEAYYDAWKKGRYIFKIDELHRKYGKPASNSSFHFTILSTDANFSRPYSSH